MYTHDFKVGDKVVYQNKNANMRVGVIRYVDDNGDCAIRFDPKDNPQMQCGHSILSTESQFMMANYYKHYQPNPKVTIFITADPEKKLTTAHYCEDSVVKKVAEARCNPKDEWDAMLGAQLAFRRLLDKLDCKIAIEAGQNTKDWTDKAYLKPIIDEIEN